MAYRVFNETGGITYPHIHPAGKSMIIYQILNKISDSFRVFAGTCQQEGFVDTISTLITELKRYNVTPKMLGDAIDALDTDNPLRRNLPRLILYIVNLNSLLQKV